MTDNYISSVLIQKLAHNLTEIRQRALFTIISKLNNGCQFDNDIARSKELISNLFRWFLFDPCTDEEVVLAFLKKILQSKNGALLIKHYGKNLITKEISQLHSYVESNLHPHIDDLLRLVNEQNIVVEVPPLESDLPLSYRTAGSSLHSPTVGVTATTISGHVFADSSFEQHLAPNTDLHSGTSSNEYTNGNLSNDALPICTASTCIPLEFLFWEPLIDADQHVLQSVENSLKNPPQPSSLLHSCEFFVNVLLHDFPAEVFIQRPSIVFQFYNLLVTCISTRITNAVLSCLCALTKSLQLRVNQALDPCMRNFKLEHLIAPMPLEPNNNKKDIAKSIENFESGDDIKILKNNQLSMQTYCFKTCEYVFKYLCVKHESLSGDKYKINQVGLNTSLVLTQEVLDLLCLTLNKSIWDTNPGPNIMDMLRNFNELLVQFGDALEYFRLESGSVEGTVNYTIMYLYQLQLCVKLLEKLIPKSKAKIILPSNLKSALLNSLLDVSVAQLYPKIYESITEYAQCFSEEENSPVLKKYQYLKKVCKGMSSTIKLLNKHNSFSIFESIILAKEALPSLEFHRNLLFVSIFIDISSEKLYFAEDEDLFNIAEGITLKLLSHNLEEVREEMYKLCNKKVIAAVGPKLNLTGSGIPGSQILFLLTTNILTEISLYGVTSTNEQVKTYAEDILILILKCKLLVSEDIWANVLEAFIPTFPILLCHSDKGTTLGRTIINMMDPDVATSMCIPKVVILKCNIEFLFGQDPVLREEAVSRLCWLLASQRDSRSLLPRVSNLQDKSMANVCQMPRIVDINKMKYTQHFYQPSSLHQVMDVLKSINVEPVIRRSALTQIGVMVEDPLLHQIFLDLDGIAIIIDILHVALTEQDFRDYPDSVIPAICILKHICLYNSNVRHELSNNIDLCYHILRGLLLYFTEDRVRHDTAILLFLLLFNDFIKGTSSKGDFSIPELVSEKLHVPFHCNVHWKSSQYRDQSLESLLTDDKWCMTSIQVHWNAEIFGGFDKLLKQDHINYENCETYTVPSLKLRDSILEVLKLSSIDFSVKSYLNYIQNATSHRAVKESIEKLTLYINFYKSALTTQSEDKILCHAWEFTFTRFLKTLPSSEEDAQLLVCVVKFLVLLMPVYKNCENLCWIVSYLKDSSHSTLDSLCHDAVTNDETKILNHELLKLITVCACQEQHFLNYYPTYDISAFPTEEKLTWVYVIRIIADDLKFNEAQHFYNLAYLDSMLSCLVHLTASLGWSTSNSVSLQKHLIPRLILSLCELVIAFHCGKGSTAAVSVMGLSITRHVMLILNHLIAEVQNAKVKGWDSYFLDINEERNIFQNFLSLWSSRDVVLRAATMQLFSSLSFSPRIAVELISDIMLHNKKMWTLGFNVLLDHQEAAIVREFAAQFLSNLILHTSHLTVGEHFTNVAASSGRTVTNGEYVVNLLHELEFYKNVNEMISSSYTLRLVRNKNILPVTFNRIWNNGIQTSNRTGSCRKDNAKCFENVTTPGLIKTLTILMINIFEIAPENVCNNLQDFSLTKMFFRTLYNPSMSINNTKEISIYCDLLEMNSMICVFLSKLSSFNSSCLGTLLYTRDCLSVLVSLLDSKIYYTHLPQLIYLRNKLWVEAFNLITILLEIGDPGKPNVSDKSVEALDILTETIEQFGIEPFLETICESISLNGCCELQNSALVLLVSLLRIETYRILDKPSLTKSLSSSRSFQNMLDTVATPRSSLLTETVENQENIEQQASQKSSKVFDKTLINQSSKQKMSVLEEIYFGNISKKPKKLPLDNTKFRRSENVEDALMAGAEFCKILLHLYDVCDIKNQKDSGVIKKKALIIGALSGILCISEEAKDYGLRKGFIYAVIKELRDIHIKLSLESVDSLRRVGDKKRICPVLKELVDLTGLLTNFMYNSEVVKTELTNLHLSDLIHKLWIWFSSQNAYLIVVLRMLCTYTTNCVIACQSLPLTSPVAGSGPRKSPSNMSLLHTLITLIGKEMDQISKTHELEILELCFSVLHNCCGTLECRALLSKSNFLQSTSRLHPAITKKQKPWEAVELIWLEFLQKFTSYPEGQSSVAKFPDVLELVITFASSSKAVNRLEAMLVLRNLAFYQPNRSRILSSADFLNVLQQKMLNGSKEEKNTVVVIIWALAANNQKAKLVLKSAQLDVKLQNMIKQCQVITEDNRFGEEDVQRMHFVLNMLRDGDKMR